ncbi:MAG: DUF2007 domain-containing protein [bacterium]
MADDLVKLEVYDSEIDAELAKARLEGAGIQAAIMSDDCGGMNPALTYVRGLRLMVLPADEEAAREVLGTADSDPS